MSENKPETGELSQKERLNKALVDLSQGIIREVEARLLDAAANNDGLAKWTEGNMKRLEKGLKTQAVNQKVIDFALTAIVQLLEEKNILAPGEYKERASKLLKESQFEASEIKQDSVKDK